MENLIRTMMDLIASEVCGKNIDKSQYVDRNLVHQYLMFIFGHLLKIQIKHFKRSVLSKQLNPCFTYEFIL